MTALARTRIALLLAALCALIVTAPGCFSGGADLSLLKDKPDPERTSTLQKVRVLDQIDGTIQEVLPEDLWNTIGDAYHGNCTLQACLFGSTCDTAMCIASQTLCVAKSTLALARPQSPPLVLRHYTAGPTGVLDHIWEIPPQSSAMTAALAVVAWRGAQAAAAKADTYIGQLLGLYTGTVSCTPTDATGTYQGIAHITHATTVFAEAFQLEHEAADLAVKAIVDSADAGALVVKTGAQGYGLDLSRRGAAHLLFGGDDGTFDEDIRRPKPFCSIPSLSPDAKAALALFREAAVSPVAIQGSTAISSLLNDITPSLITSSPTVPGGSVRQRLAELYQYTPASIESHFQLQTSAFTEARAFLNEEINTFKRSAAAQLSARTLPGGATTTYRPYAGVANAPPDLDATYYVGNARTPFNHTQLANFADPPPLMQTITSTTQWPWPHADFIDAALSRAAWYRSVKNTITDQVIQAQAMAPLALMLASPERTGRVTVFKSSVSTTVLFVTVQGYGVADKLIVAQGEDALRCALTGTVEGATPCTISGTLLSTVATPLTGFTVAVLGSPPSSTGRYYLLRPRRNIAAAGPGDYEALAGWDMSLLSNFPSSFPTTFISRIPIVPGVQAQVRDILAPSRKACSHPEVQCEGMHFDERLPLENELTQDQDGIESSWRHYLNLARDAAALSDSLGVDFINAGVQNSQNTLDVSVRHEAQQERADDELKNLQTICGTNIDLTTLSSILRGQTWCPNSASTCNFDVGALAISNPSDSNIQRLAECLAQATPEPWVSLGTTPQCFWYTGTNYVCSVAGVCAPPNTTCPAGVTCITCPAGTTCSAGRQCTSSTACPTPQSGGTCAGIYTTLPPGAIVPPSGTRPLGFFDTPPAATPDPATDRCALIASTNSASAYEAYANVLYANNFFHPLRLKQLADRLDWEARYGGFAAIRLDGKVRWETGTAFTGTATTTVPVSSGWPCQAEAGLFIAPWTCTDPVGRANANYAMLRAVLTAKLMTSRADSQSFVGGYGPYPLPHPLRIASGLLIDGKTLPEQNPQLDILNFWRSAYPVQRFTKDRWYSFLAGSNCSQATNQPACDGWLYPSGSPASAQTSELAFGPTRWYGFVAQNYAFLDDVSEYFDARIKSMFRGEAPPSGDGAWADQELAGQPWTSATFYNPIGHAGNGPAWEGIRFFPETPVASGQISQAARDALQSARFSPTDLRNALELMCVAANTPPVLDLTLPPRITTVDDLAAASAYVVRLGDTIRTRASTAIFANLPQKAVDALRNESQSGAYPQFGGQMAQQISLLRGALLRARETGPLLGNEVAQLGFDISNLRDYLKQNANRQAIADLQFSATMSDRLADCAKSMLGAASLDPLADLSNGIASAITCANSIAQINFASGIRDLTSQNAQLDSEVAITNFNSQFMSHSTNMQSYSLKTLEAFEDIDSALAGLESLRQQANRSVARALYLNSFQAQGEAELTNALGNLFEGKRLRYESALTNAKRLAVLAKRAIEQRLGMRLKDMTEDLPLVDAPASWESSICSLQGVDYVQLASARSDLAPKENFSDGFVGDYVTKLANVVESYALQNNFHEGTDTAIVSLKNDLLNVRAPCDAPGPNLLYYAGLLSQSGTPGWSHLNCLVQSASNPVPLANCITVAQTGTPLGASPSKYISGIARYTLSFGSGAQGTNTALAQLVALQPGRYRFSWYTSDTATGPGTKAGKVQGTGLTGVTTPNAWVAASLTGDWNRAYIQFDVPTAQTVTVGFWNQNTTTAVVVPVAAPMLERVPVVTSALGLTPFSDTTDSLLIKQPICEDTDGTLFRGTRWTQDCQKLCADGFASQCTGSAAQTYCYHETKFDINQRDLQLGKVMNFSGFARGNFNYRIDSIALNFVGTGIRDCSTSTVPTPCYSAGFVPYSLAHLGPFFVRNHRGEDFQASLFDGNIEHARGLAAERYLTNPLSDADRSLLQDYFRTELQGRPLDGTFTIRVWDEPGVDFEAISDVQIALKYRYWTRFN